MEPKDKAHRSMNRYHCPPFFEARICSGAVIEDQAKVEDISVRGISVRTCCEFSPGNNAEIELKSSYCDPVKLRARVQWVAPLEESGPARLIGFTIHKVGVLEWLRYRKILNQLKKELW